LFGDWGITDAIPMRRSMANPSLWGTTLTLSVPQIFLADSKSFDKNHNPLMFDYKYLVQDIDGLMYAESGPVRTIQLTGLKSSFRINENAIDREDNFQVAIQLSAAS
jgi:hypothetical protein